MLLLDIVNIVNINAFSFVICLVILLDVKVRLEKKFKSNNVFLLLLFSNLLLIALDTVTWIFNGSPAPAGRMITEAADYIMFLLYPLPYYLWVLFVNYELFHNRRNKKKFKTALLLPFLAYALLVATNPFTGGIFYFDSKNVFQHGPLFTALPVVSSLYILFAYLMLAIYRKKLDRRSITPLLVYAIPAVAGGILQVLFSGISLIWAGNTVSLLILYVNIQNRRIDTDYLTGLFNRREADNHLQHRIHAKDNGASFSAIMIDVDKFKEINDKFGHNTGDDALESVALILRKSLRAEDFIARYGGDEFLVVFDISEPEILRKAVRRVRNAVIDFNAKTVKPYNLSLSMGYAIYNRQSGLDADRFLKHIDALMYEDKSRRAEDQISFFDQSMTI